MAFDQSTRNRLQKFVSEARSILTEEFTRQLQASYGMDPKNGTIAELDTLIFLDNQGRQTATILHEMLAHYMTALSGKSEKEKAKQALDRIIREQAFTVLNRLGALRMAEARGFLLESIAKGYSSKGFQLYKNLAGTALGETGDAYRQYLFSIFDEFSLDLAVLFDRHSSQGRLFPRESALLALLDQINHFEIEHLWAEDETIGWIYQYFNSQEERKKMRAESQAPRTSRELAVRNQFFTPRYVVEFLTDNTLGRIWYEMTQGKTALAENCRYLVRRPNEIFMSKSESAPESIENGELKIENASLSQEELLKQPVYIPLRALKDPRELRMLDPACGSMHFGLYAFNLFEKIYEEAWQLESELGSVAFSRSKELKTLHSTYLNFDEFRKAIPKLIIECNIHGVDIDPRAVQIAGLSLWQRAQRSWHQMGIKPNERPTIKKSNIVCAEPMPGEKEMLREFTANLNPPVLGQLVETIFDKMELAGEAGTLLKIEEEIATSISKAKDEFNKYITQKKDDTGFFPGMAPARESTLFDFAELTDDTSFWDTAEDRILDALRSYADQAESGDGQKRLFAEDAAKGFAFIDLCRKHYDAVVMNPPFGKTTGRAERYMRKEYPSAWTDIYGAFLWRFVSSPIAYSSVGSISSSLFLYTKQMRELRSLWVQRRSLHSLVELGSRILDGATVDTALTISFDRGTERTAFLDLTNEDDKDQALSTSLDATNSERSFLELSLGDFENVYLQPFCYHLSANKLRLWMSADRVDPTYATVAVGNNTFDDFRFQRARWEVYASGIGEPWFGYEEGGEFQPFLSSTPVVYNWGQEGEEARAFQIHKFGTDAQVRQSIGWWKTEGLTYPRVSSIGFGPRLMPPGHIFSGDSISIFPKVPSEALALLGFLVSTWAQDLTYAFGRYRKIEARTIKNLPLPRKAFNDCATQLAFLAEEGFRELTHLESVTEPSAHFLTPYDSDWCYEACGSSVFSRKHIEKELKSKLDAIDDLVGKVLFCEGERPAWRAERRSQLVRRYTRRDANPKSKSEEALSYAIGTAFGRWDIRFATGERQPPKLPEPFDPLPVCPPGMLKNAEGLPAVPKDVPAGYPLRISWPGILVDDENHPEDIVARVREPFEVIWKDRAESIEQEACEILGVKTLRDYSRRPAAFFADHLKRYSKSRRQAPIYWPLQTPSGSYTLWVYYHRLTEQTLYTCVNDFVEPKLKTVTDDLNGLRNKSARSSAEEKELAKLSDLEGELKDLRDELLRIAKFWKPNLNDGVQITAAPLWKLFQHKPWQKKLKETWEQLEKGDYDWAHLAYSIWPERVLRKCHEDRSLAIAHDVENEFWEEVLLPVKKGENKKEWQPKKLSETQLRELIGQKMAEANR